MADVIEGIGLEKLKRLYREARDATMEARQEAEQAQDYYDGKQLSKAQLKALRERRQPEIWINRIAPAVNGVLGVLEGGQGDPRAFPRTNEDNNAAEVATDALRYAAENCRWDRTKLSAAKTYLVTGVGAVIVEVDDKLDPVARIIRQGEFLYDPYSRDPDFEDARYLGIAKWMYVDLVREAYPTAEIDPTALPVEGMQWDDEDKPDKHLWADSKRKRVLVCELYVNERGWKRVVFWGGGVLEEADSPYMDEDGAPACPIVAQSCFVDRDNARYGIVKSMIPIQDEINMRRSRLLHLANSRQVRITDPMLDLGVDEVRKEAARPDGVLPIGVEPAATGDMQAGQIQLLQESKNELERMGPNPAVLGQSASSQSGRAQLVQQQAGLTELTPALGGIEDLELRVYRQFWARIKQFWQEPKLIRVTDEIGAAKFLQVNEPVVQEVPAIVQGANGPMQGMQQVVVEVRNRPAEMDMDIIIESVPNTANIQQEQFAELVKLAQVYGPQEVPFDDLLEASNLPHKRQIVEKRAARAQEAQQAQGPQAQMQQAAIQLEMADKQADIEAKQAKTAYDVARTEGQLIDNALSPVERGASIAV